MRKITSFFTILFVATSAMAASHVTITCALGTGPDMNQVTVRYASDVNDIRAFALDINTGSANITQLEPNALSNYRIYPGQINIVDGNVTSYGTPYAPGDLGDQLVTVEMASLYTMDANYASDPNAGYNKKPAKSGILLKFRISGGTCYKVTANVARGGIVMENPAESPIISSPLCQGCYGCPPAPGAATNPTPAASATCQGTGTTSLIRTLSWTPGADTSTQDVYFGTTNPPPLKISGIPVTTTTYNATGMTVYKLYYWRVDEINSCGVKTTGTVWCFATGPQTGKACCGNETVYPKCLGDVRLTTPFIPPPGNNLVQSTDFTALVNFIKLLSPPIYRCTPSQNSPLCPVCYDIDGNGMVNSLDFTALINRVKAFPSPLYRHTCPYPSCANP